MSASLFHARTNDYIENFGENFDDDQLKKMFERYGQITSCTVVSKNDGKSFVAYDTSEAAEVAVVVFNKNEIVEDKMLYVARVQTSTGASS